MAILCERTFICSLMGLIKSGDCQRLGGQLNARPEKGMANPGIAEEAT